MNHVKPFRLFVESLSTTPRNFYVSIELRHKELMTSFEAGRFRGIAGVSSTADNANQFFFSLPRILLILPAADALELNDLEQVKYEDADYLCAHNLRALFRLVQPGKFTSVLRAIPTAERDRALDRAIRSEFLHNTVGNRIEAREVEVNSPADLSAAFCAEYDIAEVERIEQLFRATILDEVSMYAEEQEWLVHGDLVLPKSTRLYIAENCTRLTNVEALRQHYPVRVLSNGVQQRIKPMLKKY